MLFCGALMILVTFGLLFKPERFDPATDRMSILSVYRDMWRVICLPSMRSLFFVLLTAKIAFSAADSVTILKLSEKGFPQEMMALSVVITFPFEIFVPILLGKLNQKTPHKSLGPVRFDFGVESLNVFG